MVSCVFFAVQEDGEPLVRHLIRTFSREGNNEESRDGGNKSREDAHEQEFVTLQTGVEGNGYRHNGVDIPGCGVLNGFGVHHGSGAHHGCGVNHGARRSDDDHKDEGL